MNTDELERAVYVAEQRVLNLYNLVADPGFLLVAWDRVVSIQKVVIGLVA